MNELIDYYCVCIRGQMIDSERETNTSAMETWVTPGAGSSPAAAAAVVAPTFRVSRGTQVRTSPASLPSLPPPAAAAAAAPLQGAENRNNSLFFLFYRS